MMSSQTSSPGLAHSLPISADAIEEQSVAAIVVLYYPDSKLLDRLLQSIVGQVAKIFMIDNTPSDPVRLPPVPTAHQNVVHYIPLGENEGIATAQNVGIRIAIKENYSHVLFMDQDSALPPGAVDALLAAELSLVEAGKQVAAVGPLFIDEKSGTASTAIRHCWMHVKKISLDKTMNEPVEADYLIASGSLMRVSALAEVGVMRDELFIDWVDIEWGLRARRLGKNCYIVPRVVMTHSIGNDCVHVIGKDINLHNDIRNYYITRNSTYLLGLKSMGWRWRTVAAIKIPQYILFYSLYSKRPIFCFLLLLRAFLHGCVGRLGRLE